VFCSILAAAAPAAAQTPPPPSAAPAPAPAPAPVPAPAPAAAPAAAAPAPGYGYPPPPPGYAYPPPAYAVYPAPLRAPESVPYNGGPVPPGYHVEEHVRRGLVVGGALTLGIPWALSVVAATGANYSNQSGWLVVPALGPWITLAARKKCDTNSDLSSAVCYSGADNSAQAMLVLDGITQAAGTIMLIAGLTATKKVVVRDFFGSLQFTPAPVGKLGYGAVLSGEF